MSDGLGFTELEESLFGPDGTQVLRQTAGRLISLRTALDARHAAGLAPADAATCAAAFSALDAAERILIDLSSSGD